MRIVRPAVTIFSTAIIMSACSSSNLNDNGSGGSQTTVGGATSGHASGGASSGHTGGSKSTGGNIGTLIGGSSSILGTGNSSTSVGGSTGMPAVGGASAQATGGMASYGGNSAVIGGSTNNPAVGGATALHTGGSSSAVGGVTGLGGASETSHTSTSTGGSTVASGGTHTGTTVTGGSTAIAGSSATGGTSQTGTGTTTGGTSNPGSTQATGGASSSGGTNALGGASSTGGLSNTGGLPSTGGATGTLDGGTDPVARGEYLVKGVLNCSGCHTPQGGAFLSGADCFFKNGTGCLSTPNLTNDDTGLKKFTDQQIKDAITQGINPDDSSKYLFANMPYYQFANLTSDDADAIVAYLRTVPGVAHEAQANTAPFDVQPSAPEWAPANPDELPAASATPGADNGKYLATLACVTCHTVEVTGATPRMIDVLKAFQGGKTVNATVNGSSKAVQTSNLTPDATGIANWTVDQIATAITTDKDINNVTICGMRALANMTTPDAKDIAVYLTGITPVQNAITQTCQ